MKKLITFLFLLLFSNSYAQNYDSLTIRNIYSEALTSDNAYENLRYLCKNFPGRLCNTVNAVSAVNWCKSIMENYGFDKVYLQECKVRNWFRGEKEIVKIDSKIFGVKELNCCAFGCSVGTGSDGIKANVIEVMNFEELQSLGPDKIKGKIVFFNRPLDQRDINTFEAYGGAADQRAAGPVRAAMYGAVGVVMRSLSTSTDAYPHTGNTWYVDTVRKIPGFAISTLDADLLTEWIRKDNNLMLYMKSTCSEKEDATSYNVIGEISGTDKPDEIILVSGHLDCWDNTEGAHDDGAGVIHSIEVLRLLKKLNITPRHTVRAVLFMDEEMAQRGSRKYYRVVDSLKEKHVAAIESDRGGFTPLGFEIDGKDEYLSGLKQWENLLKPYGLFFMDKGYGGVDIYPLRKLEVPLISLVPDSQRYMDYHHSPNDRFENVNKRELQLGSAAITALVFLIDKYW